MLLECKGYETVILNWLRLFCQLGIKSQMDFSGSTADLKFVIKYVCESARGHGGDKMLKMLL